MVSYQRAVVLNLPKAQTIDIEFTNVAYEVKIGFRGPRKQILKGVSGTFKSGELTAIMGPSGAGKSSLLNILTGFQESNLKGNINYVGSEGKQGWHVYRYCWFSWLQIIAYIELRIQRWISDSLKCDWEFF